MKFVVLPSIETCIEIIWENSLNKPATPAKTLNDHFIIHAQSYNQYTDSIDYLIMNIIEALTMLEVDSRFKTALEDLSKSHITCSGSQEGQLN